MAGYLFVYLFTVLVKPVLINHSLSCPKDDFPSICHYEVKRSHSKIFIKNFLQPMNGDNFHLKLLTPRDGARLNISLNGFWGGQFEKSCRHKSLKLTVLPLPSINVCFKKHEAIKKAYESRIHEVEHSTLTPLAFCATGGTANEATIFYKRLSSLLSEEW